MGQSDPPMNDLPTAQIDTGDNSIDNKDKQTISPAKPACLSGKNTDSLFHIRVAGQQRTDRRVQAKDRKADGKHIQPLKFTEQQRQEAGNRTQTHGIDKIEEAAKKQRFQEAEKEAKKRKREIAQAEKRIAELDRIFKRIYEDDISGAISHERFLKLSSDYEAEQKELTEQVKAWRQAVETFEQDQADFASFAAIVRKYVGIRELTPTIVNEFVKKIIVHAPDKSSGHRRQKIELVWNFIGEVNLPGDDQTVERQRKDRTA